MNCVSLSGRIIFRYEKFMCIFLFFRKIKIERNAKLKLIAYIQRHNMLQDVTNRSSEVGFYKAKKKERKKRAVEDGRIIFRPTISFFSILRNNHRFYCVLISILNYLIICIRETVSSK